MASGPTIANEVLDFLVSGPTPEQVIAFQASDRAQERLRTLPEANRNGTLTVDEKAELGDMRQVDHFFTLIKARCPGYLGHPALTHACRHPVGWASSLKPVRPSAPPITSCRSTPCCPYWLRFSTIR